MLRRWSCRSFDDKNETKKKVKKLKHERKMIIISFIFHKRLYKGGMKSEKNRLLFYLINQTGASVNLFWN